ncbi:MAG: hypothetical protein H7146_03775 [Burkholderiaceae bacterium]|nr:hypothetical protein [Microbacteriaceae bacterium]
MCALVSWRPLPTRVVGRVMIAVSFVWPAGPWLRMLGDQGWAWPVVTGVSNLWAILVGVLVFWYPTGRASPLVESTVYFVVAECLTNTVDGTLPQGISADVARQGR